MAETIIVGGERFESYTDRMEVTSLSRPDPSWRYVDRAGHLHQWFRNGEPAKEYSPSDAYELPTLDVVADPPYFDEDGEEYPRSHRECRMCRERIQPGYTADTNRQYVRGITSFSINGEAVSHDEFVARAKAALIRDGHDASKFGLDAPETRHG